MPMPSPGDAADCRPTKCAALFLTSWRQRGFTAANRPSEENGQHRFALDSSVQGDYTQCLTILARFYSCLADLTSLLKYRAFCNKRQSSPNTFLEI